MSNDKNSELDYLKTVKRKEIREKINKAQQFCDVHEDASYKDFIDEQYRLEEQIKALELKLAQSEQINLADYPLLNHKVKINWLSDGYEETYCLVSPVDQDVVKNYISVESPLGKVLVHGELGEVLQVELPNGREEVKILEINVLKN